MPGLADKHATATPTTLVTSRGLVLRMIFHLDVIEYRVERVEETGTRFTLRDVFLLFAVVVIVSILTGWLFGQWAWSVQRGILLTSLMFYLWLQTRKVHYERVMALPTIGLQLETHRQLTIFGKNVTTSSLRTFIPLSAISNIVINEGLCGWNVRRYLAILPTREPRLHVVFPSLDPPFEIVREVYHGLRETLFDEWEDDGLDKHG